MGDISLNNDASDLLNSDGAKTSTNVFDNALQVWSEIDLPSLQKKLDEQVITVKDDQKSSLVSRKNLASKTKDFKKLTDEEKLDQVKVLLKLYQNEIDSLTNKKKNVEGSFFGLYRTLAEAPDPRPLLEHSLEAVLETTDVAKLKREINRLNEELSKKADYEQLKQRLISNEQRSAEVLSTKVNAKADEFKGLIEEKEANWRRQEVSLQNQIKEAQKKIEELRTSKEITELQLNSQQTQEDSVSSAAISAELEIVSRDAESSKKRIVELEKRNEQLRRELANSNSNIENENLKDQYNKKVSELEGDNALLLAQFEKHKRETEETARADSTRTEALNREILQLSIEIKGLKEKLEKASDYEEIKHELHLIRQIEFGNDDDTNEGTIDSVIIQKNRSLTKELAELRSVHEDFVSKINQLEKESAERVQELDKVKSLNVKLENDMASLRDISGGTKFNDTASLISSSSRVFGRDMGSSSDDSILPIIKKQRDRFRDRNIELEDETKKQHSAILDLKRNVNTLKKDNEDLYEKTRYLASIKNNLNADTSSQQLGTRRFQPKPNIDESNPYREVYESRLHPIEQFRIKEQERISSKLSPLERIFISGTRAILATRMTRFLFLLYCIGLHLLVIFMTIYTMSVNTAFIREVGLNSSTGGIAQGGGAAAHDTHDAQE